jgi:hypothetical protein
VYNVCEEDDKTYQNEDLSIFTDSIEVLKRMCYPENQSEDPNVRPHFEKCPLSVGVFSYEGPPNDTYTNPHTHTQTHC